MYQRPLPAKAGNAVDSSRYQQVLTIVLKLTEIAENRPD